MKNKLEKPSPEAKALSLFLMSHKAVSTAHKEDYSLIKELWSMVLNGSIDIEKYLKEVQIMLESYGGYSEVVEKTVKFYIEKTGEWKPGGDDKYSQDTKEVADRILQK